MAYEQGRFVWFELVTPNKADAVAFWTEVCGFSSEDFDMGEPYKMLKGPGGTIGGVVAPRMEGVPPHVTAYLSVEDVDASASAVVEHGGKVLVPPTDLPIGRFAVVADPQGATFQLWKDRTGDENRARGVDWVELWAADAAGAVAFYRAVFGHGQDRMPMSTGEYHLLTVGETMVAGVMKSPDPGVPPMWLPYFIVDDVDGVAAAAREHGGQVHAEPMSMEGVGRFAILADRQGLVAGVLKPESRA